MKKRLLVTGATGFLGSHFVKRLETTDYQPYLFAAHDHEDAVQSMDLTRFADVQRNVVSTKADVVVHLGGIVNLARDFPAAQACVQANIFGTLHLLEAMRRTKPALFIYVSTEEIYGDASLPFREDWKPQPPSPYAVTKLAGEHLCDMYGKYLGFPVIILRIGTIYGPGDSTKRFIPSIITRAIRNEYIPLNSGKKARDYVFVEDVVDALMACLDRRKQSGTEVVNIGGGKPYTLQFVTQKIIALCHSTSFIHFDALPDRILESDVWHMDIGKAKKVLGWSPKTPLITGLRQSIAYYKRHAA